MILFYKVIAICTLVVAIIGIGEFVLQKRFLLDVFPKSILARMMEDNPYIAEIVGQNPLRNGMYRASSIFTVPLSYGEFAAMVAPFGGYFLLHARKWRERTLGMAVLASVLLSLFVSGSRGGNVAFLITMPVMTGLWIIRYSRLHRQSLLGAIGAIVTLLGVAAAIALIFFWQRLHNIVLGGGETVASTNGRLIQWELAWPRILENPITGHGVGMAADIIGFRLASGLATVDSYILTLLVDTGIPGLLLFGGIIALAVWICAYVYLTDFRKLAELALPLGCSVLAFGFYRLVLSQRENHTLFFLLTGLTFVFYELVSLPHAIVRSEKNSVPNIKMAHQA